ncbi:unnamed protein product [Peniophora sp. CBMAI 1063]|nr:unnamed protein product [Peniophora sp. CBMAI 1063]
MAAVAALIEAGADPDALQDLSHLGFNFDMFDNYGDHMDRDDSDDSDKEFERIHEENNSVQALVQAVEKVLGKKQLKRYIRCIPSLCFMHHRTLTPQSSFITGRGKFWASVSRKTRLERIHAHFQEALPGMAHIYLHWEQMHSNIPPAVQFSNHGGREMRLRAVDYTGASNLIILQVPDGESVNVALMHRGYIAGTPVTPSVAFHLNILCFAHSSRHYNPSCGLQGIIRAFCMFQGISFTHGLSLNFRQAFDVYLDILKHVDARVGEALGRGPNFQALYGCAACGYTDADDANVASLGRFHAIDGNDSQKRMRNELFPPENSQLSAVLARIDSKKQ